MLAPRAARRAAAVAYGRADMDAAAVVEPTQRGGPPVGVLPAPLPSPEKIAPGEPPAVGRLPAAGASSGEPVRVEPALAPCGVPPVRRWSWAQLLQRVFAVDVLVCPRCGARMQVIATIDDPPVVERILAHLGILGDAGPPPGPWPAQAA